jgi:hypothetical protein
LEVGNNPLPLVVNIITTCRFKMRSIPFLLSFLTLSLSADYIGPKREKKHISKIALAIKCIGPVLIFVSNICGTSDMQSVSKTGSGSTIRCKGKIVLLSHTSQFILNKGS